jgi:sugar transferase (PEP-CTERM/EpsH1 system associated)
LRILVVLSRFPLPTDKGDKLRAWHHLQGMAEKHEVFLFCLSDEPVNPIDLDRVKEVCKDVRLLRTNKLLIYLRLAFNFLSNKPFQVRYFTSAGAKRQFQTYFNQVKPDQVFCQLARMAEYVRSLRNVQKVIDYQDAFSKGLERRLHHTSWLKRFVIRLEYKRLLKYEADIFDDFDQHFIISAQDAELIGHPHRSRIRILPNGVDVEHYRPEPVAKTIDLLFTGNMQYEPNVNCILYLVKEVLPLFKEEFGHIQLVAAGKDPARELYRLNARNLHLTGWVEDLRKYYRQSRIFVAPMQIGIGMQNKILEAMSMGMPVITSTLANNAIGAKHGKEIWIADTPAKVAEAISYLLTNTELALQLGQNARELMLRRYSWAEQNHQLNRYLEQPEKASALIP